MIYIQYEHSLAGYDCSPNINPAESRAHRIAVMTVNASRYQGPVGPWTTRLQDPPVPMFKGQADDLTHHVVPEGLMMRLAWPSLA